MELAPPLKNLGLRCQGVWGSGQGGTQLIGALRSEERECKTHREGSRTIVSVGLMLSELWKRGCPAKFWASSFQAEGAHPGVEGH